MIFQKQCGGENDKFNIVSIFPLDGAFFILCWFLYNMQSESLYGSLEETESIVKKPQINIKKLTNPRLFLSESAKHEFVAIVAGGSLLAFNAGFVNVVSLLISDILVSHTTGNISKTSVFLAAGQFRLFAEHGVMVPCFIFGSFLTTLMVEDQTFHLVKFYYRVFLWGSLLMLAGAIVGTLTTENQVYAYLATIACGMQNAMTTKYSGRLALNKSLCDNFLVLI
jgi:hypothetical protein